jgi:hypothetical protein
MVVHAGLKLRRSYPSLEGWWMKRLRENIARGMPVGSSLPAKLDSPVREAGFQVFFLLLSPMRNAILTIALPMAERESGNEAPESSRR